MNNEKLRVKNVRNGLLFPFFIFHFSLFILLSCNEPPTEFAGETWATAPVLKEVYTEDSYFLIGNIISPNDLTANGGVRFDILKRHYDVVTAENHMKPDQIAPAANPGSVGATWNYRFSSADSIVNAANAAGMKVHGHTLIWHSQSPAWLAAGGEPYLNKFVTDVVTHFKGDVISWDVVNEAFRDNLSGVTTSTDWKTCLRPNDGTNNGAPWNNSSLMGSAYIEKAFLAARAADPSARLYYNDYNLNNVNKARAVYNMVSDINTRYPSEGGRPLIDGVGMQSHHHLGTNPQTVEDSITLFASLNVEVSITELDIQAAGGSMGEWGDGNAQQQAAQYAAMFRVFRNNASKIKRVTFWGIDDGTSWRSNTHPCLLDKNYNTKPAFYAVMNP